MLQICEDEDFAGLELSSGLAYTPDFEALIPRIEARKPLLVHNYFPAPEQAFVLDLASSEEEVIQASLHLCKRAIDLCVRFGAPFYSVHGGFAVTFRVEDLDDPDAQASITYRYNFTEAYDNLCKNIHILSAYARERGVRLLIENNAVSPSNLDANGSPQLLMADIDEIEQFFQDIADPNVGLLVDVGHVNVASQTLGFDRDEFINRLSGRIEAFHLSENDRVFDLNKPVREDSWFMPHLLNFPNAQFILEAYRLSIQQIIAQRNLIKTHLAHVLVSG